MKHSLLYTNFILEYDETEYSNFDQKVDMKQNLRVTVESPFY